MIYCVEDEKNIRELLIYTLETTGFSAKGMANAKELRIALKEELPDLILLDIMLPEEDGLSILKKLRDASVTRALPIILLTAKGSEYDKVKGLDSGADDYISKPFGMMELISRIRALLRRTGEGQAEDVLQIGDLAVYPGKHQVRVQGQKVELTLKEFELLNLMMSNPEMVFTREKIQDRIWGYAFDGESRTVDVHIRTLRQKLGSCGNLIKTVRGVGYRLSGETE